MKLNLLLARIVLLVLFTGSFFLFRPALQENKPQNFLFHTLIKTDQGGEEEEEEGEEAYTAKRLAHEFKMLRNPITGKIPANIREIEFEAVRNIPSRGFNNTWLRGGSANAQNNYTSVGPNNIAGRSRGLAFDRRNANIVLTGGVTGGIFRSTDGGFIWNFVSGENDIRSATSISQDPTSPDVWYCGTGEVYYPNSGADIAGTVGHGMYKSTNNGASWAKLSPTEDASPHQFNGSFDLVHRVAVHPVTGHVYAAVHNRIMKSTDKGNTWQTVLGGVVSNTSITGITEVIISSNGSKIFAAFSGKNADRAMAGVWESASGNTGSWTRIAGGVNGATDSIPGWRPYPVWTRVVLALNSTNTKLFVLYKNGRSADGATPEPEADLFRADISSGVPASYAWANLNEYVPDEPGFNQPGIDPYTTQFEGYNMSILPKPDNDNILFIGGSVLERVDLTKTDPAQKFRRVGGYGSGFFPQPANFIYPNHHPDIHGIYFPPGATDVMFTVDDGGVHKTVTSTLADTVRWQVLDSNLQTLQFQFINIQQDLEADFIIGGAQDNGTQVNLSPDISQAFTRVGSGDGASAAISQFFKTGSTWRQYWYHTISEGSLIRTNATWQSSGSNLILTAFNQENITPSGLAGSGQWLTLMVNDPDTTEHLYYNNKNKLYRTRTASTVNSFSWTEMTGVGNTVPSTDEFSAMAISKSRNGTKYLYFGTDAGKVYRLNDPNTGVSSITPVSITPSGMTAGSYVAGIAINPRSPDTLLVVVSNYDGATPINNIFWTGNATAASPAWQVIENTLAPVSSQSCAIIVKTTGVEYYVGTSVGLYSTTSIAGNSTQWFNEGSGMLKKAIVRSLVNRQKDNTLVVGTHGNGAFIAKIGNAVTLDNDIITGINNPVTNDKNFIQIVYPTLTEDEVFFKTGNMFSLRTITVQVFAINGQRIMQSQQAYQNGSVKLGRLAPGNYVLQITSSDGKYRHVQKITKN